MPKRNAVALRAFTHADDAFAKGDVILGMEPGQFDDWSAESVDLVREATAAEVAKARGDKPARAPAPKRAHPKKGKPAAAATTPEPATEAPTNPDPAEQA